MSSLGARLLCSLSSHSLAPKLPLCNGGQRKQQMSSPDLGSMAAINGNTSAQRLFTLSPTCSDDDHSPWHTTFSNRKKRKRSNAKKNMKRSRMKENRESSVKVVTPTPSSVSAQSSISSSECMRRKNGAKKRRITSKNSVDISEVHKLDFKSAESLEDLAMQVHKQICDESESQTTNNSRSRRRHLSTSQESYEKEDTELIIAHNPQIFNPITGEIAALCRDQDTGEFRWMSIGYHPLEAQVLCTTPGEKKSFWKPISEVLLERRKRIFKRLEEDAPKVPLESSSNTESRDSVGPGRKRSSSLDLEVDDKRGYREMKLKEAQTTTEESAENGDDEDESGRPRRQRDMSLAPEYTKEDYELNFVTPEPIASPVLGSRKSSRKKRPSSRKQKRGKSKGIMEKKTKKNTEKNSGFGLEMLTRAAIASCRQI